MAWLEEKLCPSGEPGLLRDVSGIAMIVLLAAVAMLTWDGWNSEHLISDERFLSDIPGQMASGTMLMAMGFLLALRRGAIDLSVWTVGGLGGLLAAWAINCGISPAVAVLLAGAAGLATGAFSGTMVVLARVPSAAITLLVAIAIAWAAQAAIGDPEVRVADDAFDQWRMIQRVPVNAEGEVVDADKAVAVQHAAVPLQVTRMLIVAGFYAATMLVLLGFDMTLRHGVHPSRRLSLMAAMCASGLLSAVGGAMRLVDYSAASVPARIIGDMRVIPAAVIAGGLLFAGRGRTMLACIGLPVAMLIATIWRQQVWAMEIHGYALQLLILAGMAIVSHLALIEFADPSGMKMKPRLAAAILCIVGIVVVAFAAAAKNIKSHELLHMVGCGVWTAGAIMLLAVKIVARRKSRPASASFGS